MLRDYQCVPLRTPTIPPATHTNCYLVGKGAAVIVDPGSRFPVERQKARRMVWRLLGSGGGVQAVVLTHHHGDHCGGARSLATELGVPLAAHPWTLEALRLGPDQGIVELTGGDQLDLGGGRALDVLHTPGHAPGHLCLVDRREQVLLAGDMIAESSTIVIDPPEGDMALYMESLGQLRQLGPVMILPAHGDPILHGPRALGHLLDHRRWRERRILAALGETPADLYHLTRAAYPDILPLMFPLASRSALAHLLKLEEEGKAAAEGDRWMGTCLTI